jgi:ubiquinone/menaquinone biosynthesis C-methylase UbiE
MDAGQIPVRELTMRDFNRIDFYIQKKRIGLIERYVPPDSYVLDIGCGYYPQNLIGLKNKIRKGVGIDMDIPEASPSDKISFVRHRIDKTLPFPDDDFDCVTILAVLEHLEYPKEIIEECRRVLKPGGKIIITMPSSYSKPFLLALAGIGLISREEIFSHRHYFRLKELEKMLIDARFKKIVSRHYNLFMNSLFVFEK